MEQNVNIWSDDIIDDPDSSAKVRLLNDLLRCTLTGGTLLITAGVITLSADKQAEVLAKVRAFDAFTPDNDPWGEHDMGAFEIDVPGPGFGGTVSTRIFWKLDYYDLTRATLSPDPANPAVTERVLTIMLGEEY